MVKELFKKLMLNAFDGRGTHLSGTKRLATMLRKEVLKYNEDSKLDFELGVITEDERQKDLEMLDLMLKSLDLMEIY